MFFIKEILKEDRPREKLVKYGVDNLSNIELLAIILRTGNRNKSVLELAKEIYEKLERLKELKKITYEELVLIDGIKEAKATTLLAAIELGKRLDYKEKLKYQIRKSEDVYLYFKYLEDFDQEHFYCLYLNTKMFVIKHELVYKGTIDKIVIHPREIFKNAIKISASSIIIVHNHPSGDAKPSNADDYTTNSLKEVASIIDIEIIDHIIIGYKQIYSYREKRIQNME